MACFRPVTAWKPDDGGSISFRELANCREIKIPCGKCIGCRVRRREDWAIRIIAESKMHDVNWFATITYDDEHLPHDCGLHYRHIQLFHKKLRQAFGPFRFFVAGEYGDESKRPHYHAIYFGLDIPDLVKSNSLYSSQDLYTSERVSKLWGKGFCSFGSVTLQSARYTASYVVKKDSRDELYERFDAVTGEIHVVEREFAKMSLKPGIGYPWLEKYWTDIYKTGHNAVIVDGSKKAIPKAFDRKMEVIEPMVLESNLFDRYKEAEKFLDNNTRQRLEVREMCAQAREKFNKERKGYAL